MTPSVQHREVNELKRKDLITATGVNWTPPSGLPGRPAPGSIHTAASCANKVSTRADFKGLGHEQSRTGTHRPGREGGFQPVANDEVGTVSTKRRHIDAASPSVAGSDAPHSNM